jgi:AcrR family transcriptional regulator
MSSIEQARAVRRAGRRPKVSREQVLDAALGLADDGGLAAVTMASVGARLGVEAMSLYRHIGNKEEMLDGLVDRVFAEIEVPADARDWRDAMRWRAISTHAALRRHQWAIGLMESRAQPGPATLGHHDAMVAILLRAGFDGRMAVRVYNLLDSYIYGFALQEATLPFSSPEEMASMSEQMLAVLDIILGALPEPSSSDSSETAPT